MTGDTHRKKWSELAIMRRRLKERNDGWLTSCSPRPPCEFQAFSQPVSPVVDDPIQLLSPEDVYLSLWQSFRTLRWAVQDAIWCREVEPPKPTKT